eukprot:gene28804-4052_t
MANDREFQGPPGTVPMRFIGRADDTTSNFVDGELVLPKGAQYPARVTVIGGAGGVIAARVRDSATKQLQRKWLTPRVMSDFGAVHFAGAGGHAALPAGGYFVVDAFGKPAEGDGVTRELIHAFLRAAGARAIMQRAIFSAASLGAVDPAKSFAERGARVAETDSRADDKGREPRPAEAPPPAPPDAEDRRRGEEDATRAAAAQATAQLDALLAEKQQEGGQGADSNARLIACAVSTQSRLMQHQITMQGRFAEGVVQMGEAMGAEVRLKQQRDGGQSEKE